VAQEGREAHAHGGEPLDSYEGRLGLGQSFDEVGVGGDSGGEPVTQPADLILGREDRSIQVDHRMRDWVPVAVHSPVDQFCLGDWEPDSQSGPLAFSLAYCFCRISMCRR